MTDKTDRMTGPLEDMEGRISVICSGLSLAPFTFYLFNTYLRNDGLIDHDLERRARTSESQEHFAHLYKKVLLSRFHAAFPTYTLFFYKNRVYKNINLRFAENLRTF